jgi:hypothetical protein
VDRDYKFNCCLYSDCSDGEGSIVSELRSFAMTHGADKIVSTPSFEFDTRKDEVNVRLMNARD